MSIQLFHGSEETSAVYIGAFGGVFGQFGMLIYVDESKKRITTLDDDVLLQGEHQFGESDVWHVTSEGLLDFSALSSVLQAERWVVPDYVQACYRVYLGGSWRYITAPSCEAGQYTYRTSAARDQWDNYCIFRCDYDTIDVTIASWPVSSQRWVPMYTLYMTRKPGTELWHSFSVSGPSLVNDRPGFDSVHRFIAERTIKDTGSSSFRWPISVPGWNVDPFTSSSFTTNVSVLSAQIQPYDGMGEATLSAVNGIAALDVNSIQFVKEAVEVRSAISRFLSDLEGLGAGHFRTITKSIGGLYLAYRYGIKLTVSDTAEIANALSSLLLNDYEPEYLTTRGSHVGNILSSTSLGYSVTQQTVTRCKIAYQNPESWYWNMIKTCWDWDFYPTAQNLWDMIPFSFVIDWLLGVENLLEGIDANNYTRLLSVVYATYSVKTETSVVYGLGDQLDCHGTLRFTRYTRSVRETLAPPPLRISPADSFRNWWEATALIVQNL